MQAAFPLLSAAPIERRVITLLTAFPGPGGRDAVEVVTRAVSGGRYGVARGLGGRDVISEPPGPCLWRFTWRGRTAAATIRPGHVRPEFIALGAKQGRGAEEEARLDLLKREMADRPVALPAAEVYAAQVAPAPQPSCWRPGPGDPTGRGPLARSARRRACFLRPPGFSDSDRNGRARRLSAPRCKASQRICPLHRRPGPQSSG